MKHEKVDARALPIPKSLPSNGILELLLWRLDGHWFRLPWRRKASKKKKGIEGRRTKRH
jgi:hypothetical protein